MEHHLRINKTARYYTYGKDITKSERIWFVLHGYGQLAEYFIRNFDKLNPEKNFVVAPEGMHRFYLEGFSGRVGASWMTRSDRENDIRDYVEYLDQLYEAILEQVSGKKDVWVLGFSQGVATAARWIALGKPKVDKAIFWAGSFPPDLEPVRTKKAFDRPAVHCISGSTDKFITSENLIRAKEHLRSAGLNPTWHEFSGGHEIPAQVLDDLIAKVK